jgi:hypothetical protein
MVIGAIDVALCLASARFLFHVPIRGSLGVIVVSSLLYLSVSLMLGLLISGVTRNQFAASQMAMLASFMPATMLSGFVYDIHNMPTAIRVISLMLPATHFMDLIKGLFLAGTVWPLVFKSCGLLLLYLVGLGSSPPAPCARGSTEMAWLTVWLAQILSLCRKEFLAVIKDPANRTILFVPVLMQSVLFGYGATFDLTNVPYVVVDESRSATSTALLARIDGTGVFRRAATLETPAQIAAMIDAGKATVAITIPSDFDQRLTRGKPRRSKSFSTGAIPRPPGPPPGRSARSLPTSTALGVSIRPSRSNGGRGTIPTSSRDGRCCRR